MLEDALTICLQEIEFKIEKVWILKKEIMAIEEKKELVERVLVQGKTLTEEFLYSKEWWRHIPRSDLKRDYFTGYYLTPPIGG